MDKANELATLDTITPLKDITDQIMDLDLDFTRSAERILAVLEMLDLYTADPANFKAAYDCKLYILEKNSYIESFKAFNSTWKDIHGRKEGGSLLNSPKHTTYLMGNGISCVW